MTIQSGGAIIDPEGTIHDTNGYVSHGEWLRKTVPEYAEYFKSLLKALPEELLEIDEDDDSDVVYDLEKKVLAKALENDWYRARVYDGNELTVQYDKKPPSPETIERLLKTMKLRPDIPIKIITEAKPMNKDDEEKLIKQINSLPCYDQEKIFRMRYGLSVKKSVAIEELMRSFNVTIEQLWKYKCRAMRLSRHPRRSLRLKDFLEEKA